jgi:HPt (histidine-containing phosphotransfer) domain-containing protein
MEKQTDKNWYEIPLTWNTLLNICGDEEMVCSIVDVFLEEGVYALDMIEKAVAARDGEELKLYCHRMKGTARYIGDEAFVQACLDAEMAATDGKIDEAIELSEKIKPITEKYLDFFKNEDWRRILKQKDES